MTDFESVEVYLPDVVKEIVTLIGLPDTEKLVRALGGVGFYLGGGGLYYNKIKAIIGESATKSLAQYFKGYLYLPKCEVALRVLRNKQLNADFLAMTADNKMSGRAAMLELCQKYRLSDRQGWDIVYSFRRTPHHCQATLF